MVRSDTNDYLSYIALIIEVDIVIYFNVCLWSSLLPTTNHIALRYFFWSWIYSHAAIFFSYRSTLVLGYWLTPPKWLTWECTMTTSLLGSFARVQSSHILIATGITISFSEAHQVLHNALLYLINSFLWPPPPYNRVWKQLRDLMREPLLCRIASQCWVIGEMMAHRGMQTM